MRLILFPTLFLILLTACAGTVGWVWYKPGASETELAGAVEECLSEAKVEAISPMIDPEFERDYYEDKERRYRDCMRLRGWEIVDADEVAVPWEEEKQKYPTDFDLGLKY